ncbi:hypothetical protein WJX84_002348 [Apatococcus fuscideae]|uniref:Histone deacetylase domain-containing protein n=2 Tax=Apatococcus TaxID=904362 RepID=A0AAW1SYX0_9CHLO
MENPSPGLRACARPDISAIICAKYNDLGGWMKPGQLPIVYSKAYNIGFMGIENLHPFDSKKFGKVVSGLERAGILRRGQLVTAVAADEPMLRDVHDAEYLHSMRTSPRKMAQVVELPPVACLPNFIVQRYLHHPQCVHVGGTMLAAALALEHGWSINLGGGMHHAHRKGGAGWCAYDDHMLALRRLRRSTDNKISKALYIDLDVHQGNGVERDKLHFDDDALHILDMYNSHLWPGDVYAQAAINTHVPFSTGIADAAYLNQLQDALDTAFRECQPNIVLYNAGTDILDGDPLGRCCISPTGIAERDQMVWMKAISARVPICMVLSGGYASRSAAVVTDSIEQLFKIFSLGSMIENR